MGRALAALLLLAAAGRGQDATVDDLVREYRAIRARVEVAETFEQGRRDLARFVDRLAAEPAVDPALVYHGAKELARDPRLAPDELERARYAELAAEAAARTGRPDAALAMVEVRAELLAGIGRLDAAIGTLEQGLGAYADASRRPETLVTLAELLRRAGRFDAALARLEEARAEAGGAGPRAGLVRAALLGDLGSPELAEPDLERLRRELSAGVERGEADAADLASVRIELLRIAIARGDHERVLREARAILDDPAAGLSDPERAGVLLHLGTSLLERERDRGTVGEAASSAREVLEEALNLGPGAADAFFLHTRLASEALEGGDLERARAQLEALRAIPSGAVPLTTRIEGDVLAARLALAGDAAREELLERRHELEDAWEGLARAWDAAPREQRGVAFLKYAHRRAVLSALFDLELRLAPGEPGAERALEHLLAAQERSSLARARPADAGLGLADLRRDLLTGPGHGLLVYVAARDRSHVFAIDRDAITCHPLARSSILEDLRRPYVSWLLLEGVREMGAARRAEVARVERERAAALAAALLPDGVRARVARWERLSISGSDTLGLVPFAWLPAGDARLGTDLAIDFVPSLPHATRSAAAPAPPLALDLVIVTGALPGPEVRARWPELGPVDLGRDERAWLEDLYHGRVTVLAGPRAGAAELGGIALDGVGVLQFLVHGVDVPDATIPVALVLSGAGDGDDGLLRAEHVAELDGAPRLVVLTACGSGQGPTLRGDPLAARLTGAWLARGARAVLAAHHDLSLGEARRTTRALHACLRSGGTPAEALRAARCELVHEEPELAPFLNAMQQVIGLGHEPLFAPAEPRGGEHGGAALLATVGLAALLLGLGLVAVRRSGRP